MCMCVFHVFQPHMPLFSIYSLALEQDQEQSVGLQLATTTLHTQTFIQVGALCVQCKVTAALHVWLHCQTASSCVCSVSLCCSAGWNMRRSGRRSRRTGFGLRESWYSPFLPDRIRSELFSVVLFTIDCLLWYFRWSVSRTCAKPSRPSWHAARSTKRPNWRPAKPKRKEAELQQSPWRRRRGWRRRLATRFPHSLISRFEAMMILGRSDTSFRNQTLALCVARAGGRGGGHLPHMHRRRHHSAAGPGAHQGHRAAAAAGPHQAERPDPALGQAKKHAAPTVPLLILNSPHAH